MPVVRPHAEMIVAWAMGYTIQSREKVWTFRQNRDWRDDVLPDWNNDNLEFQVKPQELAKNNS